MFNFPQIDRDAPLRNDWLAFDELQSHSGAQTILWYEDKVLTQEKQLKLFQLEEIKQLTENSILSPLSPPLYLGLHQNQPIFARQINQWSDILEPYQPLTIRAAGLFVESFYLGLLFYSQGLFNWHRTHQYCAKCGHKTSIIQAGHARSCLNTECRKQHFPRIEPAVIFAITNNCQAESQLLLARQASWDECRYSVLAGFVEAGESLENAVRREGREEVGLKIDRVKYVASQPWPFPSSLMLGFECETRQLETQLIDQEIEHARWVTAKQLPTEINRGAIKLPFPISISYHLIDRWFLAQTGSCLDSIIK